jgi:hypothetical protein
MINLYAQRRQAVEKATARKTQKKAVYDGVEETDEQFRERRFNERDKARKNERI